MRRRQFLVTLGAAVAGAAAAEPQTAVAAASGAEMGVAGAAETGLIEVDVERPLCRFDPDQALGSSMDILPYGVVDKIYTPPVIAECLSAGWGPISYRQNTELQIAAWHWNSRGTWSEAPREQGYFTGDAEPTGFLRHSYGYPLPRRGNTRNNGTLRGYSRLTDGNPASFWKSNPYLARHFTREPDARHPQWIIVDLGVPAAVNALRLDWAHPYARRFEVQHWTGEDAMNDPTGGVWSTFPLGMIRAGRGGRETVRLAQQPVTARFLRVVMTESSGTAMPGGGGDVRDRLGYAIHEVYAGLLNADGSFTDLLRHSPDENQTPTYCSTIDPWHTAADLDEQAGDQTGFDLFFTSGITNRLPAMIPVAMLYGTPENSAAQLAYLKQRGYPIAYVEMGEEPDGQYAMPEDYAALYLQWADALHRVDPALRLGGPVFTGVNQDIQVWPDAAGRTSWFGRFLDYLEAHGRLGDLAFMSFEHYPFPPCNVVWEDLYREPALLRQAVAMWRQDGLPDHVPLIISESNLSWGLTPYMVDVFSALWLVDNAGAFLSAGGAALYHSPIQPEPLRPGCHGWATFGNFVAGPALQVRQHTAQFFASRLINREWVQHGGGEHELFSAAGDMRDAAGHDLVTAYAVRRPDGEAAVLVVNRDQNNARPARIQFRGPAGAARAAGALRGWAGPVRVVTFGAEQYRWHEDQANSHATPGGPPAESTAAADGVFVFPRASITVLRGPWRA